MRKLSVLSLALASSLSALPVASFAAEEAASPLTFNIGAVSEYRYRNISQSRFLPAAQGGADYAFSNGAYIGAWASTIKWIKDGGGDAPLEIDFYGGHKGELAEGVAYDLGLLQYYYNNNKLNPSANTLEAYGALTFGPATFKYSRSLGNLFGYANSSGSGYFDLTASFDIGDGLLFAPHIGYQKVAGAGNDKYSYTDYSLTLSKEFNGVVPSISIVGTDAKAGSYVAPDGKNLGRNGIVLGLKYNF